MPSRFCHTCNRECHFQCIHRPSDVLQLSRPPNAPPLPCVALHTERLLPNIRKQVVTSTKAARGFACRARLIRSSGSIRHRRSTAPSTKIIVLGNGRCTPSRTFRLCVRRGSCHLRRLSRCRRSPCVRTTPCIHVGEPGEGRSRCWSSSRCARGLRSNWLRQIERRVQRR